MFLLRMIFLFLILYMQYFVSLRRNFKNSFFTHRVLIVHNDTTYWGSIYCAGHSPTETIFNEKLIYLISRIFSCVVSSCFLCSC